MAADTERSSGLHRSNSQPSLDISEATNKLSTPTHAGDDGPPLLSRRVSLNESWLTSFSQSLSLTQTDISQDEEPHWFDDAQSLASMTSSMAEDPLPIMTQRRRGSLDLEQMRKDAADDAKKKRKWTNNRVASWILNSGKPSNQHGAITRISESAEFLATDSTDSVPDLPQSIAKPTIAPGSLTDAVKSAGLIQEPKYHGKRRLSLRELNACAPSGF